MSDSTIREIKNLYGKRVKFWFTDDGGRYESTGLVTEYIVAENCLTIQDDKDGVKYYVGIDQVEILKEEKIQETKEARDRDIIHIIQSRCVHRRRGVIKIARAFYDQLIFYCQDCEKILYGMEAK